MGFTNGGCLSIDPKLGGATCPTEQDELFGFIRKGIYIPAEATLQDIQDLVTEGNFIGVLYPKDPVHEDSEDSLVTDQRGFVTKRSEGVKGWSMSFDTTPCRDNEWALLDRSEDWSIIWGTANGVMTVLPNSDGTAYTGFNCYIYKNKYQNNITSDGYGTMIHVQLRPDSNSKWDTQKATAIGDDFSYDELNPVEGVSFNLVNQPAVGDTDIIVTATGQCNDNFVSTLDETVTKLFQDGNEIVITSMIGSAKDKTYTITVPALTTGLFSLEITNGTESIIAIDDTFYAGQLEFIV